MTMRHQQPALILPLSKAGWSDEARAAALAARQGASQASKRGLSDQGKQRLQEMVKRVAKELVKKGMPPKKAASKANDAMLDISDADFEEA